MKLLGVSGGLSPAAKSQKEGSKTPSGSLKGNEKRRSSLIHKPANFTTAITGSDRSGRRQSQCYNAPIDISSAAAGLMNKAGNKIGIDNLEENSDKMSVSIKKQLESLRDQPDEVDSKTSSQKDILEQHLLRMEKQGEFGQPTASDKAELAEWAILVKRLSSTMSSPLKKKANPNQRQRQENYKNKRSSSLQ